MNRSSPPCSPPIHLVKQQQYPGIAAHLRACGPCGEDFDGLLAALREQAP